MERTLRLIDLFEVERLHPAVLFGIYLTAAQGYVLLRDYDGALAMLERYVNLAVRDIYPLEFRGDRFFDKVQNWFRELELGLRPPRSEAVIRQSLVEGLTKNPALQGLSHDIRFQNMVKRLETHFAQGR